MAFRIPKLQARLTPRIQEKYHMLAS